MGGGGDGGGGNSRALGQFIAFVDEYVSRCISSTDRNRRAGENDGNGSKSNHGSKKSK